MADLTPFEEQWLLAEYPALNADIQRRLIERAGLVSLALTATGLLGSFSGIPGEVLLAAPWVLWRIALWMLHNEVSIRKKTAYLREIEAKYFPSGAGFLTWKKGISSPLLSTKGLNIESILVSILVSCQIGLILFGAQRVVQGPLTALIVSGGLAMLAMLAVGLTLRADFARRERKHAGRQKAAESSVSPEVPLVGAKGESHAE